MHGIGVDIGSARLDTLLQIDMQHEEQQFNPNDKRARDFFHHFPFIWPDRSSRLTFSLLEQ